jgi:hypothetical protein
LISQDPKPGSIVDRRNSPARSIAYAKLGQAKFFNEINDPSLKLALIRKSPPPSGEFALGPISRGGIGRPSDPAALGTDKKRPGKAAHWVRPCGLARGTPSTPSDGPQKSREPCRSPRPSVTPVAVQISSPRSTGTSRVERELGPLADKAQAEARIRAGRRFV